MPYEIKRKPQLKDTLTLTDEDKNVKVVIDVDLDLNNISKDFRKKYVGFLDAQKAAYAANEAEDKKDVLLAYDEYGKSIYGLMCVVFGEESSKTILDFFENDLTELSSQILPFIQSVVYPAFQRAAAERTRQMRQYYRGRRKKHVKWMP